MPGPRRSIEIELQWLVSVYSPKLLDEIQSLLNVILFQKKGFYLSFRLLWRLVGLACHLKVKQVFFKYDSLFG